MNETDATTVTSESAFFIEAEEVNQLVSSLTIAIAITSTTNEDADEDAKHNANANANASNVNGEAGCDDALRRLRIIFDKYLECPTLLDPYLERIVTTLSRNAVDIAHSIYNQAQQSDIDLSNENDNEDEIEIENTKRDQESRQKEIRNLKRILSAIYIISKVRGRKQIQKFLKNIKKQLKKI